MADITKSVKITFNKSVKDLKHTKSITPKIGYWWTFCCEKDLQKVKTKRELEIVLSDIEDNIVWHVFRTKKDALRFFGK